MQSEEITAFLEGSIFARLATVDAGGWPYVVPVWHEWSENRFWLIGRKRSAWAGYLVAEPRCAVSVDETGGQRKGIAPGRAEVVEERQGGGRGSWGSGTGAGAGPRPPVG